MAEKQDTKLTSLVWNYFKLVDSTAGKKTICQLCDIKLAYQSGSTKSMWNHLKAKHGHKLAEKTPSKPEVTKPKQAMITQFAGGSVFSKDKKLACYMAAAEVTIFTKYWLLKQSNAIYVLY